MSETLKDLVSRIAVAGTVEPIVRKDDVLWINADVLAPSEVANKSLFPVMAMDGVSR